MKESHTRFNLVAAFVVAIIASGGLWLNIQQKKRLKAEASTYSVALLVLEETDTALMQVAPGTTAIKGPNQAALRMFGYTYEEMDGMEVAELIPDWYKGHHTEVMQKAAQQIQGAVVHVPPTTMQCTAVAKGGREFSVFVRIFMGKSGTVAYVNRSDEVRFIQMPPKPPQP